MREMLIDEIRQGESAELELKRVPDEQGRTRLAYLEGYRDGTGRRREELLVDAIGRFFATPGRCRKTVAGQSKCN